MEQTPSIREQSLKPEAKSRRDPTSTAAEQPAPAVEALDDRILTALTFASEKKALGIIVLDLREIASFTDYFVIASGTNTRQVQAIADSISEQLKKQGVKAGRIEGYKTAEWVLLDYGDFVVHVFEDKARRFYDLERLWRDASVVPVPPAILDQGTGPAL